MLIETTITPDEDTRKKLFARPWAFINFKAGARRATDQLAAEVRELAPRASGSFERSVHTYVTEYDQPYRIVCRVQSFHPAAEVIEYGASPHFVPIADLMNWAQIKGIGGGKPVVYKIQKSIARRGLPPHFTFTRAFGSALHYYRTNLEPIEMAIHGHFDIQPQLMPEIRESLCTISPSGIFANLLYGFEQFKALGRFW
jgi:hypothetical protein